MKTWEPHPEGPHSHEAASVSGADYDPSARPEGEPCSSLERNRVCEEGNQMGSWDASERRPMNPNIASVYPEGSTLDLDYCAGYRSGYRSYQAEIRAGGAVNDCQEKGEACSDGELEWAYADGFACGGYDYSQSNCPSRGSDSGYPLGSPMHRHYVTGYNAGWADEAAFIREGKVLQWRNKRRALRGLKPVKDWDYYAKLLTELKLRRETDADIGLSIDISRAEAKYSVLPPKPRDK